MRICAVAWCDRAPVARALCRRCYARWWRGANSLDSPRRYATREDKERLRYEVTQRRMGGESTADIASSVGVNVNTLSNWFREWEVTVSPARHALARAPRLWQPWTREEAKLAYTRTDLPLGERVAILGRSHAAVESYIRKYQRRPDDPYGIK